MGSISADGLKCASSQIRVIREISKAEWEMLTTCCVISNGKGYRFFENDKIATHLGRGYLFFETHRYTQRFGKEAAGGPRHELVLNAQKRARVHEIHRKKRHVDAATKRVKRDEEEKNVATPVLDYQALQRKETADRLHNLALQVSKT